MNHCLTHKHQPVGAVLLALLLSMFATLPALADSSPSQTYYLFVLNEAAPGMEQEFNRWYDQQHAQDVLVNPDYESSQRYTVSDKQLRAGATPPTRYAIAFQIVTRDIAAALQMIHTNIRTGRTVMTNSIAQGAGGGGDFTYQAMGEVLAGHGAHHGDNYLLMEFAAANAGKEKQFNEWYGKRHVAKIAALPGVKHTQRLELSAMQLSNRKMSFATQYLTMYAIEADAAAFDKLQKAMAKLDLQAPDESGEVGAGYTYREIGQRMSGEQVKKDRAKQ